MSNKELILNEILNLVSSFLYYDREEDEELPKGVIVEEVKSGHITVYEMVDQFKKSLLSCMDYEKSKAEKVEIQGNVAFFYHDGMSFVIGLDAYHSDKDCIGHYTDKSNNIRLILRKSYYSEVTTQKLKENDVCKKVN